MSVAPRNYRWSQIAMHWLIVVLIVGQYSTSGAIVRTHQLHLIGQRMNSLDMMLHTIHNRAGLAIVGLMVLRFAMRWRFGVPVPNGASWQTRCAQAVHIAFYLVLIAEGLTGAVASYFWWPASTVHVILFNVLLTLIVLHVAAAIWHQFIVRDKSLKRMLMGSV